MAYSRYTKNLLFGKRSMGMPISIKAQQMQEEEVPRAMQLLFQWKIVCRLVKHLSHSIKNPRVQMGCIYFSHILLEY